MPRKRAGDVRRYGYVQESMKRAVADVKGNGLSVKEAARINGINRTTLINHLKNYKDGKVGRPAVLTPAEETIIVHALKNWVNGVLV